MEYWGECVLTAVLLINRISTPRLKNNTPFELLTSKQVDYTCIRVFGCLAYMFTSSKNRHKFQPRSEACIFLGYPSGVKGYKLLDLETHSIPVSRHVVFHEELFPFVGLDLDSDSSTFFPDLNPTSPVTQKRSDAETSVPASSIEISPFADPIIDDSEPFVQTSHVKTKKPAYLQDYYCHSVGSSTLHEISSFLMRDL